MKYNKRLMLYCNQSARYEKFIEADNYGNPTYAEPINIKVRREGHYKLFRNESGETKTSTTRIFSTTEVNINDRIDGKFVIDVAFMTDKQGNIIGWEAYV